MTSETIAEELLTEESVAAKRRKRKNIFVASFTFLIICIISLSLLRFIKFPEKQSLTARNAPAITPTISPTPVVAKKERIGFLPSWTVANRDPVYPQYFSQLIYFGFDATKDGDIITHNAQNEQVLEWTYFLSGEFANIRREASQSGTKIIIAIKCFDNETIDSLISNSNAITRFTGQLDQIVKKYNLDGVNIDFEYVTDSDFPTAKYLAPFLKTVSQTLKRQDPAYIVSFDVNATSIQKDPAYNMKAIGEAVDQVILMAYDFRRQDATRAGPSAPLDKIKEIMQILFEEVSPEKIILAIPLYGYEWQTNSAAYKSTTITGSGALATYKRVKALLKRNPSVVTRWDDVAKSPWLYYTLYGVDRQIYYEDERSIIEKMRYAQDKHLAGTAFWAIGYDGGDEIFWNSLH